MKAMRSQGERRVVGRLHRSAALFLAALLFWCSLALGAPITPKGVQCPTATVQTILVAKLDCCKRIVGYEVRKIKEGERGFKQCQCAEKRQSASQAQTSPRYEALPPALLTLEIPSRPLFVWTEPAYEKSVPDGSAPPALRPPTLA